MIEYIGYSLLLLYLLYCVSFCCAACITLIQENYFSLLRYSPLRSNDNTDFSHFEIISEQKLDTISDY